jgi:serine phosphatase RsbU (regulator of sigma subunit)
MSSRKIYIIILLSLICIRIYGAPLSHLDSLIAKCESTKDDSSKMYILNLISLAYNTKGYADIRAFDAAQEALAIALKHNYKEGEIGAYLYTGYYFELKGDAKPALDNFLKAQDIAEKNNYKIHLATVYDNLSLFYRSVMKNDKKALEYSRKDLAMMKELGNKVGYATALVNAGNIYYDEDSTRQALQYYLESVDFFNDLKLNASIADVENNIGSAYTDLKEYNKAIEYYQKALSVYQDMNNKYGIAMCYGNMGNVYNMKGDAENGVKYSELDLQLSREIHSKDNIAAAYTFLSEGYSKMGNYQKAYEYQTALSNLKDTLYNEANTKQVNDMQVKYDTEKKERENKILELSVNRQKIISYSIFVGLILVIALGFFVYRGYVNKKKAHEELAEKNRIIEEKNKDILDSINYAKTIQQVILPLPGYLKESLGEYFIVYKPRDVVSGDFYWCYSNESKVMFTVADCTGHGVPGAFMSMIGNSLLNEIIIENKVTDAAEILNNLRTGLLRTLQQKGQNNITRDGMDIALCVWDKNKNTVQFAGANNSLYLVRDKVATSFKENEKVKIHYETLAEFLPDKQPIGYFENKIDNPFSSSTIQLQKDDVIYISSDGYADQFGGEAAKKFSKKKFREMLVMISTKQIQEQKNILDNTVDSWKGSLAQTDDICLMGVKVS